MSTIDVQTSTDEALIAATLRGDKRCYETLVRRYQKLIYNIVYQLLRDHEQTRDVTQDALVKAYKALPQFKSGAAFKPWLVRIATNAALNKIRDERRKQPVSLDDLQDEETNWEPPSGSNPEAETELRLNNSLLADALNQLPARRRYIFVLFYQFDLSYAEIASVTGEQIGSIKSLLFRTREQLRNSLKEKIL